VAVVVLLLQLLVTDNSTREAAAFAGGVGAAWAAWAYLSLRRDGLD
jgi:hypothetical protein